jgi:D-tagatose-1,6-bisphosphate aldolase subunit GatZ/KbaZ
MEHLLDNLKTHSFPLTLVSQYLPQEYAAIRAGQLEPQPEAIIRYHIRLVLRIYATACGMDRRSSKTAPKKNIRLTNTIKRK